VTVTQRMSINQVDPAVYKAVLPLQKYANSGGVDEKLLLLVQIRASQINHCAWCLDMHLTEARKAGIAQRKLDLIAAWEETPALFDERDQAVLAFTEEVTLISEGGVSDKTWTQVRAHFDEKQTLTLIMAITAINVWNRMNVTVHAELAADPASAG
jgi:AhpD family alkylhydroperoxidase